MAIFKQAKEIKNLKRELKEVNDKLIKTEADNHSLSTLKKKSEQTLDRVKEVTRKIESERDELKALVKSQTENELLVTSLKIVFEMLQPKKEIPDQTYISQLAAQQQSLQSQLTGLSGSSYSSSLASALGLSYMWK